MPALVPEPVEEAVGRRPQRRGGEVGVAAVGLAAAFAAGWAASRSGAADTDLGRMLGRLDGSLALLLLLAAAVAQRAVTARALAGAPVPSPLVGWRRVVRRVLVPWWGAVAFVALCLPAASGRAYASGTGPSGWELLGDGLLLSPLSRPAPGTPWPPAGAGQLGPAWVVLAAVLLWALLPLWERVLRRVTAVSRWGPVEVAVGAGGVVALVGLVLRVAVATTGPGGWSVVARVAPPAQLDVIGVGLVLGALAAGAAVGAGPLAEAAATARAAAPRLGAVVALALVVGISGPSGGSVLDPGGWVPTLIARVGLALVGTALVLWALLPGPTHRPRYWATALAVAGRDGGTIALGAVLAAPVVAQVWSGRIDDAAGLPRAVPLVLATVGGALAAGVALAEVRRWAGPGWRGTALGVGIVVLAVALPLPTLLRYQGPPMEEGFMLVFPERVLAGDIPNRDFLHLYGPGSLWGLAAWFEVVGTTLTAERTYGLFQHLGIIFGLFTLALPWGRRAATACGLLGVLLVMTPIGLTALAWNGAVALAVVGAGLALRGARALDAGETTARRWLVAGGAVLGVALLFRPDLVVGVGLAVLALGWRRWRRDLIVPLALGLALGVAPILVHLATAGIGPSFEGMFLQPVFDLRGGRTLPLPPAWSRADGALQAVAQLREVAWPFPMVTTGPGLPWPQAALWFWALPLSAAAVLVTGVVAVRRAPDVPRNRTLLVVGALGVGLLPQALQRPDTTHLAWVSCVSLVFLPVACAQWAEWWVAGRDRRASAARRRLPPATVRTAAVLAPVLAVVALIPAYTARTWTDLTRQNLEGDFFGWAVHNGDRTFYLGSPEIAADAQAVVDELQPRLQAGERLLVGPADLRRTPYSDAYFYFLFPQATPGTRYIEMDPGIANAADSGLDEEVATSDWLILSHVWDDWDEPNDSRVVGSDAPNQVVQERFCPVGDQGSSFQVYRRCR